jgi:hypothetical protein
LKNRVRFEVPQKAELNMPAYLATLKVVYKNKNAVNEIRMNDV